MTINTSVKGLITAIATTLLLSACGGGGSDGGSASNSNASNNDASSSSDNASVAPQGQLEASKTETKPLSQADPSPVMQDITAIDNGNHQSAALAGTNVISLERQACGLGGLDYDETLADISVKHAQYNQYLFSNANLISVNEHNEDQYKKHADISGANNPYFTGRTLRDRMDAARYLKPGNSATENIARKTYYSPNQKIVDPSSASIQMARSLLSAPYHLRQLVNPNINKTGSALVAYTPYNRSPDTNKGYIFVNTSADTQSASRAPAGIFTYPCEGTQGTVTALYHESPNPVKDMNRNLRTDPIGQPIYISVPSANRIKVSNIKIHDAKRNISVPAELLDGDNDPYKGTNYELKATEAFILPLPDSLKSCEIVSKQKDNCGLHGNTTYNVSFDVLVNNQTLQTKSFSFTTGDVNY